MAKKQRIEAAGPVGPVENWPISRLKPYERNARRHAPEQVTQIAASMREFGWTIPILAGEDGVVIAGHGRLEAARTLGYAEVPVIVARGWTEAQRRAYTIADNRLTEQSAWDNDLLLAELGDLSSELDLSVIGFSAADIARLSGEENDPQREWVGMPEFVQEDKTAFRTIPVHFKDQDAVDAFAKLVGQPITDRTRFIWFPEIEIETYADKRYVSE